MNISGNCIALIKHYEGLAKIKEDGLIYPYKDPIGIPTIGYGFTRYPDGSKVSMEDNPIDKFKALAMLINEVEKVRDQVLNAAEIELKQCELDALVSFTYNLGLDALIRSTLFRKVNKGAPAKEVAAQFMRWVYAGKEKLPGLVKRRNSEAVLYQFGKLDF